MAGHGANKTVYQNHWTGKAWGKGVGGMARTIYRYPEILAAPKDATIYIVEGERDVETMVRSGYHATCNIGGAEKWHLTESSAAKALKGRTVVVIADADEVGRKHALAVEAHVGKVGKVKAVLECTRGKDVTDHFLAGGKLDELVPTAREVKPKKPDPPAKPTDWRRHLKYKKNRQGEETEEIRPNVANAVTILAHDPQWEGVLAYDEFAESLVKVKPPLWRSWDMPEGGDKAGDWTDEDTTRVQTWLSTWYDIDVGSGDAIAAVKMVSMRRRIHPVRDWLDGLRWDGKKRLTAWLVSVMGCDDNEYVRAVGQAWAVSAVARIYEPGCKVDTVLVLEGKPGIFKSSVLRALVGDEWFLEMNVTDVSNKDAMQILKRKWIAEFPEIDGLSKKEQSGVKAYFSRQVDTYRASYGKGSQDYRRQTVFAATTNKNDYLTDETGGSGRRMWPVRCRLGDVGLARAMRDQLWAEARARYQSGEKWHITDPEIRDAERDEQEARFQVDPWEPAIAEWLAKPTQVGQPRDVRGITTGDVMGIGGALGIETGKHDSRFASRVGAILRRLGWIPGHPEMRNGARIRVYRPASASATVPLDVTPAEPLWQEEEEPSEDMFPPIEVTAE